MLKPAGLAAALLFAGLAAGAAAAQKPDTPPEERERIVDVAPNDPAMQAAERRAIAELPDFYRRLANPGPGEDRFMVKFDIQPGRGAEYVWATDLDRSTTPMTATLLSHPERTADRAGDRIRIAEADIIDWAYIRNGVAQGAYTQRVLLDRMSPDEAAEVRANMGW
jgi:uncharacterized protein YegJ (DUF2314 family)